MTTFSDEKIVNNAMLSAIIKSKMIAIKDIIEGVEYMQEGPSYLLAYNNLDIKIRGNMIDHVRLGGYMIHETGRGPVFYGQSLLLSYFNNRYMSVEAVEILMQLARDLKDGQFKESRYISKQRGVA